jgi:hypothetical protein
VIDKLEGEWQMQGEPVARAVPASGPWVYTLYRKDDGPFVHALNNVPVARGVVAVDTATLAVRRTLLGGHRVSAVVTRGARVYAQDGAVVALDAASRRVVSRRPTSVPPATLAAVLPAR